MINQKLCELCNEYYDASLMRYYQYTRNMHEEDGSPIIDGNFEIIKYFICEDCVINHKRYDWELGIEL